MTKLNITWLGHASFRLRTDNLVIYVDPFNLSNVSDDADFVFITHSHYDHLSLNDIRKVYNPETQIITSLDGVPKLRELTDKILGVQPNQEYDFEFLHIRTVPAYNINKPFHPKSNNWVGYIIEISGLGKFFHTGDSDNIPEYQQLSELHIDTLAIPCGGTYTMNAQDAFEATKIIQPKQVIPMHWGSIVGNRQDAFYLEKKLKDSNIKVLVMGQ